MRPARRIGLRVERVQHARAPAVVIRQLRLAAREGRRGGGRADAKSEQRSGDKLAIHDDTPENDSMGTRRRHDRASESDSLRDGCVAGVE
ncbi:hypothetical protein [Burkholderia sp. AU18528]|uniref:hypothetical protein n=1 Tax=Burkholderia sp. AU18528 TaxID=2015350 RepID=UPI0015D52070|nr:hypothetical protein [Burkholderia sp. AU18528]